MSGRACARGRAGRGGGGGSRWCGRGRGVCGAPNHFEYVLRPSSAAADVIDGRAVELGQRIGIDLKSLLLGVRIAVGVIDGQILVPIICKVEAGRIAQRLNRRSARVLQMSLHVAAIVRTAVQCVRGISDIAPVAAGGGGQDVVGALVVVNPVYAAKVGVGARWFVDA